MDMYERRQHKMYNNVVFAVALPIVVLKGAVTPYQRGFFCDDQSLTHPEKADTIPTWLLVVSFGFGTILIVSVASCIRCYIFSTAYSQLCCICFCHFTGDLCGAVPLPALRQAI